MKKESALLRIFHFRAGLKCRRRENLYIKKAGIAQSRLQRLKEHNQCTTNIFSLAMLPSASWICIIYIPDSQVDVSI